MKTIAIGFLTTLAVLASAAMTSHAAGAASKPNVVIILTDDKY